MVTVRRKNKWGDSKEESNDSSEILDRAETSGIPGLSSGKDRLWCEPFWCFIDWQSHKTVTFNSFWRERWANASSNQTWGLSVNQLSSLPDEFSRQTLYQLNSLPAVLRSSQAKQFTSWAKYCCAEQFTSWAVQFVSWRLYWLSSLFAEHFTSWAVYQLDTLLADQFISWALYQLNSLSAQHLTSWAAH